MYVIETRQQKNGNWWCNGTIEGYDHSFESNTMHGARFKMRVFLKIRKIPCDMIRWENVQYYREDSGMSLQDIAAQTTRLTHLSWHYDKQA